MKNYVNLDMAFKEYAVAMHVVFDTRHFAAGEVHAHRGAWSVVAELYPLDLKMILRPSAEQVRVTNDQSSDLNGQCFTKICPQLLQLILCNPIFF